MQANSTVDLNEKRSSCDLYEMLVNDAKFYDICVYATGGEKRFKGIHCNAWLCMMLVCDNDGMDAKGVRIYDYAVMGKEGASGKSATTAFRRRRV